MIDKVQFHEYFCQFLILVTARAHPKILRLKKFHLKTLNII